MESSIINFHIDKEVWKQCAECARGEGSLVVQLVKLSEVFEGREDMRRS